MKKLSMFFALLCFGYTISFAQFGDLVKGLTDSNKPKPESSYSFQMLIKYDITLTDKKSKVTKMNSTYFFSNNGKKILGYQMNMPEGKGKLTTGIIDMDKKLMVMLMEEQKMAITMNLDPSKMKKPDNSASSSNADKKISEFKKTGNTKMILNHKCEEWLKEDEKSKMSCWMTKDALITGENMEKIFDYSMQNSKNKITLPSGMEGVMMEMDYQDLKKGDKMTYSCSEINTNKSTTVDIAGYKIL